MFVDSAMEHAAVAPAGLLRHAIVLLENNDAEGRVPAPAHQLSGDGAPYDPCSNNADVIRVHRAGSLASWRRWSAQCSWCHSTSTAWAAQQRGVRTTEVFQARTPGEFACLIFNRISTGTSCLFFAEAGVKPLSKRLRQRKWSMPACPTHIVSSSAGTCNALG